MKPIIHWVQHPFPTGGGYWACRWRRGFAYKSGVGRTPREAYEMWARLNEVQP